MVLNLFLGSNIYNKMAKNKNHDKVIREYKKKKSTPKKWKWIWKPEWVDLKESFILSFNQFISKATEL